MADHPERAPLDYAALAERLAALAYPLRLEILDTLAAPVTLSEIRVKPMRATPEGGSDRAAAKQTVQAHLEKLVDTGLVVTGETEHLGRTLTTYAVNPQRLYALTEDVRRLSVKHTGRGLGVEETAPLAGAPRAGRGSGPRLVLVHGAYEGRAYPLATAGAEGWTIGRRRGATVTLDYDPYVSLDHARIITRGDAYSLVDLPDAKNGTWLNWEPLARGASADLEQGDVIGVGRSMLIFYAR